MLKYADDILLMAKFTMAKIFNVKFNTFRTRLVICGSSNNIHNVLFEGTKYFMDIVRH